MSQSKKIALGIATIWPILYMVLFFFVIFSQIVLSFSRGPFDGPPFGFLLIFPLHFLTMILMFVLLFIYIRDVIKSERIAPENKALWAIVLFLGNFIAMPIYWYFFIWKEPTKK